MSEQSIGNQIKALRKSHRMTQRDMASALNVAASTISNWENNWRSPSVSELRRVADLFKVSLSHFELQGTMIQGVPLTETGDMQLIEHRPLQAKGSKVEIVLMMTGLLFVFLQGMLSMALCVFLLWIGVFTIVLSLGAYGWQRLLFYRTTYRKTLVPAKHEVVYVSADTRATIKKRHSRLSLAIIVSLFLTVLAHSILLISVVRVDVTIITLVTSIWAILTVLFATMNYWYVRQGRTLHKVVSYHDNLNHLGHYAPTLATFSVLVTLIATAIMTVHASWQAEVSWRAIIIALLVLVVALNYGIMLIYRYHIQRYTLEAHDETGESRKLFS